MGSRKVRVIAKIKGFTDLGTETPWVCVHKPKGDESESGVAISFGDRPASRKESYEVDYCYQQNEGNDQIFSREVKPLISGVFGGCNATIIACGARGSGKTYVIQGSDEEPGLAVLTMAEILPIAEENGKSIAISFYEVQDQQVFDLLDPKRPTVFVLKDKQGNIQLKGLSQVPVKSILEFQKLYLSGRKSRKPLQKIATELSHKGLIVHVFSHSEKSDTLPVGKMNFVDLAGYEDSRRTSSGGLNIVENTKINKSIYALQNVIYALNLNESHVPYRESKLTHMLQDSLGGTNRILMVTCINPSFCQDSIYMVSLASRSCQSINQVVSDSTKKTKSLARPMVLPSHKSRIPGSVSTTVKKQTVPQMHFSERKANDRASAMKGRKLFDDANRSAKSDKVFEKALLISMLATSLSEIVSATKPHVQEEEKSTSNVDKASTPVKVDDSLAVVPHDTDSTSVVVKEGSSLAAISGQETIIPDEEASSLAAISAQETIIPDEEASSLAAIISAHETIIPDEHNHEEVTPSINSSTEALFFVEEGQNIDKENNSAFVNDGESPPISARLQELSNNLKLLYSSTPSCIEMPPKNNVSFDDQASYDIVEPKTPEHNVRVNDKWEIANISASHWETFSMRSSGMKNNLVQEYLTFLNSASKEDLKKLKGIGEKRATYILELREESPEPFKNLDDLKDIGLSAKQVKGMMKKEIGELFN